MVDRLYLRAAGVSLLLDLRDGDARVAHWGADLGAEAPDLAPFSPPIPPSSFDQPTPVSLIPQPSRGWRGTPGIAGDRAGGAFSPRFVVQDASLEQAESGQRAVLAMSDDASALRVETVITLHDGGLLTVDQTLTNLGGGYTVAAVDVCLPIPIRAGEGLDLTGRWSREKHPQRHPIGQGTWTRSARHGRTGHDSTLVIAAGTPGFRWRDGEVWALHLGWSGDHTSRIERAADGQTLLAVGELLKAGELVLGAGESYHAPTAFAAYSGSGLDGISAQFHDWVRSRSGHPSTPRPVVLNTWEAVYFAHDLDVLKGLADAASGLGVERFVLDDGWFLGRRDDTRGLGDWVVDRDVWPQGLTPLIEHVKSKGMQFGLWVEPEMINEDSQVAREHPDWIARPAGPHGRTSLAWRSQQVIDLVNPDAWNHVYESLHALLAENAIDYLKWDQNRDQVELGHDGRASTHDQTLAAYRLFDALRAAHPAVEIESCSSGGGRIDLGILQRTDRVWASDTNDALERQTIQRWTQLVLPPELVGQHVGPPTSHTTGRTHALSFRVITALFGHFGLEWDVRGLSESERTQLRDAIAFYTANRPLLHGGRTVRVDRPDESDAAYGVVAHDRSRAVVAYVTLATSPNEQPPRLRLPGLDPDLRYRVRLGLPLDRHSVGHPTLPPWLAGEGEILATGRVLAELGIPLPGLHPERALLLDVTAVA